MLQKKKVKSRAKIKLTQQMRLFFARLSYYETANNSQGFQWVIVLFV